MRIRPVYDLNSAGGGLGSGGLFGQTPGGGLGGVLGGGGIGGGGLGAGTSSSAGGLFGAKTGKFISDPLHVEQ